MEETLGTTIGVSENMAAGAASHPRPSKSVVFGGRGKHPKWSWTRMVCCCLAHALIPVMEDAIEDGADQEYIT